MGQQLGKNGLDYREWILLPTFVLLTGEIPLDNPNGYRLLACSLYEVNINKSQITWIWHCAYFSRTEILQHVLCLRTNFRHIRTQLLLFRVSRSYPWYPTNSYTISYTHFSIETLGASCYIRGRCLGLLCLDQLRRTRILDVVLVCVRCVVRAVDVCGLYPLSIPGFRSMFTGSLISLMYLMTDIIITIDVTLYETNYNKKGCEWWLSTHRWLEHCNYHHMKVWITSATWFNEEQCIKLSVKLNNGIRIVWLQLIEEYNNRGHWGS